MEKINWSSVRLFQSGSILVILKHKCLMGMFYKTPGTIFEVFAILLKAWMFIVFITILKIHK